MAAVFRREFSATLEVFRPQEVQCKPPLREAGTLGAIAGHVEKSKKTRKGQIDKKVLILQSEKVEEKWTI
jgi:hypothetical protein